MLTKILPFKFLRRETVAKEVSSSVKKYTHFLTIDSWNHVTWKNIFVDKHWKKHQNWSKNTRKWPFLAKICEKHQNSSKSIVISPKSAQNL